MGLAMLPGIQEGISSNARVPPQAASLSRGKPGMMVSWRDVRRRRGQVSSGGKAGIVEPI